MKDILRFISGYFNEINKAVLGASAILTALLIYLNYHFKADTYIDSGNSVLISFFTRYFIFLIAFAIPYSLYYVFQRKNYFKNPLFSFLILLAPAIFSWKIAMNTEIDLADDPHWNYYWNQIVYLPARLLTILLMLFVLWILFCRNESFFGFKTKNFNWKPYLQMIIIFVPVIVAASTQQDFLLVYPKLKDVSPVLAGVNTNWTYKLLYELAYGTDFISVELFFRGFLVLAFVKFVGQDAILPMACFYCTIHFGKPLGECISSYFGGMLLGIIVLNTRSIIGGLVVHLGIAWLMELGGALGNSFYGN